MHLFDSRVMVKATMEAFINVYRDAAVNDAKKGDYSFGKFEALRTSALSCTGTSPCASTTRLCTDGHVRHAGQ